MGSSSGRDRGGPDERLAVPLREISFSYVRSGGAGGQNVNKVSSKAILRWPVGSTVSLPPDVHQRFLERFGHRLTGDGDLVVASDRFRDRGRNAADCVERVRTMLAQVAAPPRPRRPTRPTRGSAEARLAAKRAASRKKESRRTRGWEED